MRLDNKIVNVVCILVICISSAAICTAQVVTPALEKVRQPVQEVQLKVQEEAISVEASESQKTEEVSSATTESKVGDKVTTLPVDKRRNNRKQSKTEFFKSSPDLNKSLTAAPANDDICAATVLAVDGTCLNFQTNVDATSDWYGGCIQSSHPSVWYEFTITGINDMVSIEFNDIAPINDEVEVMLMEAPCADPAGVEAFCETASGSGPLTFDFYDLTAGTYLLYVSTQPGGGNMMTRFDICATQGMTPSLISGPEQDCSGAIPVCDPDYIQPFSYSGYGDNDEIPYFFTCLAWENNSVWYVFTPQTAGDLAFTITTVKDYDWAVYDLTDIGGCENIPSATPVLCNYSDNAGNTGATLPADPTIPRQRNWNQSQWMPGIPVAADKTYVLIIDNYTGDANGYELHFDTGGGTADITDVTDPVMSTVTPSCTDNTITLDFTEDIKCLSISPGDFALVNNTTSQDFTSDISSVVGTGCSSGDYTDQIVFTMSIPLTSGQYTLSLSASPSIVDKCDNPITPSSTINFDYLAALTLVPAPASICGGTAVTLTTSGAGSPVVSVITLSPGGATNVTDGIFTVYPSITTIYSVSASFGCVRTANTTVTVEGNIITVIDPVYKTLCAAASIDITASTTINGVDCPTCTYVWSTAETTPTINVGAGTYTVTATTPGGCTNENSASSTIAVVSVGTGGSSCDVLYVSPDGGGDGYSKLTPTTLSDAISKAACTNTIIKMQTGIYNATKDAGFDSYHVINSYVTIEGGYNSTFTLKTSDMTGGANSTTIHRSKTGDSGDPTKCSAFVATTGITDFRIQDVRIELPGGGTNPESHAAGDNKTNYGIRLGTGCTNYTIVRCYVDAGVGSAPPP